MNPENGIWSYNWAGELCSLYDSQRDEVGKMECKTYKTEKGEEKSYFVLLPPF